MKSLSLSFLAFLLVLSPTHPLGDDAAARDPVAALQQKSETGADRFLAAHPDYDGRGVVVAIFDTGVDPGAPGMQTTTDGKPKIVDMIDGSGSGDVDTSEVRKAEDGKIESLSGRQLTIPAGWNNPSGEYHIGVKRAYELFPRGLVGRIKSKRSEKWDEQQRAAVTRAKRALVEFDLEHEKPTTAQLKTRQDLEDRLEVLAALQKDYDDPGPIYDCVVFHDGEVWRAAIDSDEDGDLADEELMTNYRLERQYATFGDEDLLNYAINIYDDGNLLSIVTDAGAHGTHVAGIVAAHFPDQPELNGVAPGAQIVAVKIGDTRLGSSSMGTGEIRGAIAALANEVDLINMSYGGPTPDPDAGRIIDIYSEIVNRHGVIWVASAGNSGPALSTVGGPGGTTDALFGVGAAISPEMMKAQYSMRESTNERQYTWSSRGPTMDGDLGVKFSAPGGAISPVPNWVLQRNMLMNGTSMAAPNACGGIALLLSACKAEGIPYSPRRIRRALENTARSVRDEEVFAQGRGMVQIDAAYTYLQQYEPYTDLDLRFEVSVSGRDGARGVYLREPFETDRVFETSVRVNPVFHHDADNRDKVDFELNVALECDARWVEVADSLRLMHGGRSIDVRIDPRRLDSGAHYTEIRGYDATQRERGPLFRIPITVLQPERLRDNAAASWRGQMRFGPGEIERRFIAVPEGASWADIHLTTVEAEAPRRLVLHTVQAMPGRAFNVFNNREYIWMSAGGEEVRTIRVVGGRTIELCLAQYWSSLGEGTFDIEVEFHGLTPEPDQVLLADGQYSAMIDVIAPLGRESLSPAAQLKTWRQTLRPSSSALRPLDGERDQLPEQRQIYELTLDYDLKQKAKGKAVAIPALVNDEDAWNSWESLMWAIYDEHKRLIAFGSSESRPVSLDKGDYVVRFHVRSTENEQLERLSDMPIWIDRPLDTAIKLKVYDDPDDVLTGGRSFGTRSLEPGVRRDLYIAAPDADSLPDDAEPGDRLTGSLTLGEDDAKLIGAGKRPGGYPITMVIPPAAKDEAEPKASDAEPEDGRGELDKLAEEIRDLQVARLGKLHGDEHKQAFDALAGEILSDNPDYLPVFVARLHRVDDEDGRDERLAAIVAAANEVIARIDGDALAAHYGRKLDEDDAQANKQRKEMDEQRDAMTDALYRKGRALWFQLIDDEGRLIEPGADSALTSAKADALREKMVATIAGLREWVDTTDKKYVLLHIAEDRLHGRLGSALKRLNARLEDGKPERHLLEKRGKLLRQLGWEHWAVYEEKWLTLRYPKAYQPF